MSTHVASRIKRRICAVISIVNNVRFVDGPLFPSKVSSKCPAIIFAVKCTASVPGRIRLLIVSMITINGINIAGVPCGTKRSNMWLAFLNHPNNINPIHRGRAKVSVVSGMHDQEIIVIVVSDGYSSFLLVPV